MAGDEYITPSEILLVDFAPVINYGLLNDGLLKELLDPEIPKA